MTDRPAVSDSVLSMGIRFESIGGLGAHAAGQILASAAVLRQGLNGAHFSSYGSEKKGSVIRSYLRLEPSDRPIRSSAPIDSPDYIVVFHGALLEQAQTLAGLKANGTLIYNGPPGKPPRALECVPKGARVMRVDALRIAIEEKSRPNAVLLGTLAAAVDVFDAEGVLETFSEEFASKHPEAVASNERAYRRGMDEFEILENVGRGDGDIPIMRPSPVWGYETAPIGGVLPMPGNSVSTNLTTSRAGWLPVLHEDRCIHCGLCDLVCPDLCLVWKTEGEGKVPDSAQLLGVDYHYCKGCQRCVETCPTEALTREPEEPGMAERLRVPLFPELEKERGVARG